MQDGAAMCDKTCHLKHHFFAVGYNLYAGTEPRERRHEVQGSIETGDDGVCTTVCTRIPSIDHSNMHSLTGVHSNTSCISQ